MSYSTTGTPVSNNVLGRLQLLFVNSDPLTRELYTHALNLEGYNVERAGDGPDALQWFEMEAFPARPSEFQSRAERFEPAIKEPRHLTNYPRQLSIGKRPHDDTAASRLRQICAAS
jgi:hypothetical protein